MVTITLTDEQYQQLLTELSSLYSYHWNDEHIHAKDCGSKVLGVIEDQVELNKIEQGETA